MKDEFLEKYAMETEEALSWLEDAESVQKECETAISMPESTDEMELMEMKPTKADNIENAHPAATTVAELSPLQFVPMMPSASQTQVWMPCLPSSLSAQTLFNLALNVEPFDLARQTLGFYYEQRLRYECNLLIPHPIPSYYRRGIWKALMIRRSNPGFFICNAIDVVLTYYFNHFYPEDNDVFS